MEINPLIRLSQVTDKDDPNRTYCRSDSEEPKCACWLILRSPLILTPLKHDKDDPNRANDLKDNDDPKCDSANTDKVDPICVFTLTDNELPTR
jgi:hypothetical protein